MKDGDLLRDVISQYAGKEGSNYHSAYLAQARRLLRDVAPKILDRSEYAIIVRRVIRRRISRKQVAQELELKQKDVKTLEINALHKLKDYYIGMKTQAEDNRMIEKEKQDYETCLSKVGPLYSFNEFGAKAKNYLHSQLNQLEQKYGDGLEEDVVKAIQGMLVTRDYYKEKGNRNVVAEGLVRKVMDE